MRYFRRRAAGLAAGETRPRRPSHQHSDGAAVAVLGMCIGDIDNEVSLCAVCYSICVLWIGSGACVCHGVDLDGKSSSSRFLLPVLTITQVEMAEASRRGRKIVLLYIALSAGTAIGTWVKYGFQYLSTGGLYLRYRIPLGLQLLVLVFPIVLVWRADESWR